MPSSRGSETLRYSASAARPAALACLLAAALAQAQTDELVAPYVPTVEEDVELMLEVGGVGPDDYVIDLGSGDGRIVIAAARRGALAHGVELDPELVELARANARESGAADRVAFVHGDIFDADIGRATVVTLYLFPEANLMLRPKLLAELRAGTRVVSNSFHMGEWKPDVHDMSARSSGGILLWIVPPRIEGEWLLEIDGGERLSLAVRQQFQEIELEIAGSGSVVARDTATLKANRLRFGAELNDARHVFDGQVEDDAMYGYVQIERQGGRTVVGWRATRR
ncbi:methyltransferase domain-containing protein [Candidatus Rariloculus sp.]|uniref:methyltransferase domain-containing protein n=1 Tax=Candidatus Rariloculus sp. TaxID=3101265 RepID=UPI003D1232E7